MTIQKQLLGMVTLTVVLLFFASCETSKIAYGNSYYFKATPKAVPAKHTSKQTTTAPLEANLAAESVSLPDLEQRIQRVHQKVHNLSQAQDQQQLAHTVQAPLNKKEKKELLKDKREQRKALKKEVRSLIKNYKRSPNKIEEQSAVSGNLRTGIILGAIGLVLVLIGGPAILYTIGVILLVVGLLLILLDVL